MTDLTIKPYDEKLHTVYLTGDVDETMYSTLNEKITEIVCADNEVRDNNESVYRQLGIDAVPHPPKIVIHLNTFGGYVYDGLAIYDLIKRTQKDYEIEIICTGKIMSMGTIIMMAVDSRHRYATSSATFMIHQVAGGAFGKLEEIKENVKEIERLNEKLIDLLTENTTIPREKLTEVFNYKQDWYLDANEAKEYEMINKII